MATPIKPAYNNTNTLLPKGWKPDPIPAKIPAGSPNGQSLANQAVNSWADANTRVTNDQSLSPAGKLGTKINNTVGMLGTLGTYGIGSFAQGLGNLYTGEYNLFQNNANKADYGNVNLFGSNPNPIQPPPVLPAQQPVNAQTPTPAPASTQVNTGTKKVSAASTVKTSGGTQTPDQPENQYNSDLPQGLDNMNGADPNYITPNLTSYASRADEIKANRDKLLGITTDAANAEVAGQGNVLNGGLADNVTNIRKDISGVRRDVFASNEVGAVGGDRGLMVDTSNRDVRNDPNAMAQLEDQARQGNSAAVTQLRQVNDLRANDVKALATYDKEVAGIQQKSAEDQAKIFGDAENALQNDITFQQNVVKDNNQAIQQAANTNNTIYNTLNDNMRQNLEQLQKDYGKEGYLSMDEQTRRQFLINESKRTGLPPATIHAALVTSAQSEMADKKAQDAKDMLATKIAAQKDLQQMKDMVMLAKIAAGGNGKGNDGTLTMKKINGKYYSYNNKTGAVTETGLDYNPYAGLKTGDRFNSIEEVKSAIQSKNEDMSDKEAETFAKGIFKEDFFGKDGEIQLPNTNQSNGSTNFTAQELNDLKNSLPPAKK